MSNSPIKQMKLNCYQTSINALKEDIEALNLDIAKSTCALETSKLNLRVDLCNNEIAGFQNKIDTL